MILSNVELQIVSRLVIAFIAGVIIGFDRERSGKAAGIRTQMLVCVGSALLASLSVFIGPHYGLSGADPTRLMAQVISGVGFLGAGVILKNGNKISGMTTAATIWIASAVGISIGSGFYISAGFTVFLVLMLDPIAFFQYKYGLKGDYYILKVAKKDEHKLEKILSQLNPDVRRRVVREGMVLATIVSSVQRNQELQKTLTKAKIQYDLELSDE